MTELTKEDGWLRKVFKAMDEKYKDLKQDEMHKALREYFYNLEIKPSETYRNFLVRLDTARRKLQQREIQLPAEVQGWFILRKLRLDNIAEALVLTATSGSLKVQDVAAALKAVYREEGEGRVSRG